MVFTCVQLEYPVLFHIIFIFIEVHLLHNEFANDVHDNADDSCVIRIYIKINALNTHTHVNLYFDVANSHAVYEI